jgi:hypothetical protein
MNSISNFLSISPELKTVTWLTLATLFIADLLWLGPAVWGVVDGLRQLILAMSNDPSARLKLKAACMQSSKSI